MTGRGLAGRVVAVYAVGFAMFLGLRHWQVGLPWPEAVRDAAVFALVSTVGGLVIRRALRAGERRRDGGRD